MLANDDDARDYANSAHFLQRLSNSALQSILTFERNKRRELKRRIRKGIKPFNRLSKKNREHLEHLPTNWIFGATYFLLDSREDDKSREMHRKALDKEIETCPACGSKNVFVEPEHGDPMNPWAIVTCMKCKDVRHIKVV